MCIDFKMLKVKVPIIIFGTPVFSARRDGRYGSMTAFNIVSSAHANDCTVWTKWSLSQPRELCTLPSHPHHASQSKLDDFSS